MSNEREATGTRLHIPKADCGWSASIVPRDVWFQVCLYLSIESLYVLRATSREMRNTVDSRTVWISILDDLAGIMPSPYSIEDINNMSIIELRQAAHRVVLVDRAYSSPALPHREIELISHKELNPENCQVILFPGGERLLILSDDGSFDIFDIDTREVVTHVPTLKPDWCRSQTIAQLFPISRSAGYIVVQMINRSGIFDSFDGPCRGQDFRVYKYLGADVTHLFREKTHFFSINPTYAIGRPREGVLTLSQAYQPIRGRLAVVDVILRTFYTDGSDKKVITRFFIATPAEFGSINALSNIQMVSPRFLLLQAPHHVSLFDISTFRVHETIDGVKVLQPVWSSAEDSNLHMHRESPRVLPYFVDGRPPFVRIILWAYPRRLISIDLSSSESRDHEAHNGIISLTSIDVSGLLPESEWESTVIIHEMLGGFVSGLIQILTWSMLCAPLPELEADSDQEGLWSYVASTIHDRSQTGAGMIRLANEGSFETRLGNTSKCRKPSKGMDNPQAQFSVDDISGRFIRFKPPYRGDSPTSVSVASVILYAFDQEAGDSALRTPSSSTTNSNE